MARPTAPPFRELPRGARLYLGALLWAAVVAGGILAGSAIEVDPVLLLVMVSLCSMANLFEVFAPGHYSFQPNLVFFFWGAVLLPPWAIVLLAAACFVPGWIAHRFRWYMVSFNVANYLLSGLAAHAVANSGLLQGGSGGLNAFALLAAVAVFVGTNHLLLVAVVRLANQRPLSSAIRDAIEALPLDASLAMTGACLAALWESDHALALLAAGPMVLVYRSLWVPLLTHKSRTDPKTGLYNSEHLNKVLEDALGAARRDGSDLSVVMIDLDHLRVVNNAQGHLAGDRLITGVADLLRDLAGEDGVAARFGGEEFCLMLPRTSLNTAVEVADTARARVAAMKLRSEDNPAQELSVTISAGVASYPEHGDTVNALLHAADAAVYDAKLGGRNRVRMALPPGMREALDRMDTAPRPVDGAAGPLPAPVATNGEAAAAEPEMPPLPATLTVVPPPEELPAEDPEERQPTVRERHDDALSAPPPATTRKFIPVYAGLLVAVAGVIGLLSSPAEITAAPAVFIAFVIAVFVLDQIRLDVFERANISPACVPSIALAFLFGPLGPLAAEAVIAVARAARRDSTIKWTFDLGALTIAGTSAALTFDAFAIHSELALIAVAALAGLVYYAVNMSLLSVVMGLASGTHPLVPWREGLAWLWPHYVGFGALAGIFVICEQRLGAYAFAIFGIPFAMLWVAQKQYLDRSRTSVAELRRSHDELELANRRLRSLLADNRELLGRMHRSYLSTITSLARTIEAKDPYTGGHTERVAGIASMIAAELGFDAAQLEAVKVGAVIHDIGKIGVPDSVLLKKGALDGGEREAIREHPVTASYILADLELPQIVKQMARSHHERYDGTGYPDGLAADEIPLAARVLSVADSLDAMTSDRPYRKALPLDQALEEIQAQAGTQFCPRVVSALITCSQRDPAWWSRDGAAA
jgi:diguanylate cyclase (GGDEF)-like protein/putative nucleotidyltransferase with HDIG domain